MSSGEVKDHQVSSGEIKDHQVSSVRVQPPDHKQLLIYVITNGIVALIK